MNGDEEWLDVIEPSGTFLTSLPRSVVHEQGHWHASFHCLVVRSDEPARVLLQRRRSGAGTFPGLLDLSVTGHLSTSESREDGVREIAEEIGLDVDPERLIYLGSRLIADDSGTVSNRELMHVHLLVDDTPIEALRLDADHVAGQVEVRCDALLRLLGGIDASVPVRSVDVAGNVTDTNITADDLIPPIGGYWTVIVTMAQRLVRGERPLAI